MAAQKKQLINLLPQEEFAASTLGRVLTWILSTFRVIVIITETVVMVAFLSRFYLDARITDLNDQIKLGQATIEASKTFEADFRSTQKKIEIASSLFLDKDRVTKNLEIVTSLTPTDVVLSSFTMIGNQITLKASTPLELSVSQELANLKASPKFEGIELTQVSSTDSGDLNFTIDMKSKEGVN